jgi:HAD superfamily hydrolase (TIGR01450 family)
MPAPARSSTLLGSTSALAVRYDVALLDLDGVVYLGNEAIPGVAEALGGARAQGMRLAFVTNNAARPPEDVAAHLRELGIAAQAGEVTTSAQAAAHYLADRLPVGSRVLVVGTTGLIRALRDRGLEPVERDDESVAAVVQGYSSELTWKQLAQGCLAINRGVPWIATNLDPTVPSPLGRLPGNGSMVAALRHATGVEPVATGKPDPTMHRESVQRAGARNPIVVGDRLDTDIEGATAVGCASLLVLTGVTTIAELLAAPPRLRPNYVARSVGGLLHPHPSPERSADGWACRGWRAEASHREGADAPVVLLHAPVADCMDAGSELDPVRAACAAAWELADDGAATTGSAGTAVSPRLRAADDGAARALADLGMG